MKKLLTLTLAALLLVFSLVSCKATKTDISGATSLADLAGAKIAAQAGTVHAEVVSQIKDVKSSTYPEFSDMLTALKSGAIDGYIAEEPTALTECLSDETLGYIHLKNNETGFTVTAKDVGIAIGLKTGSELTAKINGALATISNETRTALMEQMFKLCAGENIGELVLKSETPSVTNGVLKVAMECAYRPFNWTDLNTPSTGAVKITGGEGENTGMYANGYDVQIAQYVANKLGMKLEIYQYAWDSLIPAVQAGTVDAIVAGMSPTAEREEQVDFTDVYYESNLVIIYNKK